MAPCNSTSLHILILLFQLLFALIPHASPFTFNFSGNQQDISYINFLNDSYFNGSAIQLTKDQRGTSPNYSVGSATYYKAVRLWDKASGMLASFTTNFTFAIDSFKQEVSGDGLAFFLSPFPFVQDGTASSGGGLGLFNSSTNKTENKVVAIEFDSYMNPQYRDISANHLGIDIGSIVSVRQVDMNTSIRENVQFIATVNYDAVSQNLSVFLSNASDTRRNWGLFYVVDLRRYLPENVAVGFSAATGAAVESHTIYAWDFVSSDLSSQDPAPMPGPSPTNETVGK